MDKEKLQNDAINTIRFLSADAVQNANSGHAGLPMGTAAIAYTLFKKHLKFNPRNPDWSDRDRFVLSGGHGSMLLYSLFYLTGYDLALEELKNFRRWGSRTPGHPEYGVTKGVEITTGPLGQGLATAVGMAMAEAHLAAVYNRPGHEIINHYTYVLASDGDLMEGVTSEACSLAGHLRLGKLIVFYDDNRITIDGSTDISFTEDRAKRYEAYHWQVLHVEDGNNVEELDAALRAAKSDPRPSIIICRTHIGYGYPTWQDNSAAHSGIPSKEELEGAKRNLGYPTEPLFYVSDEVLAHYREAVPAGEKLEAEWNVKFAAYEQAYPELAAELKRVLAGELPAGWEEKLPVFKPDVKGTPTRSASNKVINALSAVIPELMGGSADLTTSNSTLIENTKSFQADQYDGRYIYFGVREHAMGAIMNGLAVHKGIVPFAGTFLVFSDYLRPALRLSALSHLPSIWLFSHDSFNLGEDGPTHQPVEHLTSLRLIPNLVTLRPADANETSEAWRIAIQRRHAPTAIALSRQPLPVFDREKFAPASGLQNGAYVLADLGEGKPRLILIASGSEVELIVRTGEQLASEGIPVRLVSFPSWELFRAKDQAYQDSVLLPDVKARLMVEAGTSIGFEKWVGLEGDFIAMDRFGASAPNAVLFEKFGFNLENVLAKSRALLAKHG
ncbi:MAG TPA: transketolase [Anaerolineaceae bacterium]|jgi:transketolase|nr:transketolase [Anaerolineaceae bacterium]HOT24963.1 transketolase [Anaerolineaceae bacterium]HQH57557.1 transketolase [Anaerolineaceae bacterium]HQK03083.1 transketolase [Anaerolineaceae bacterium]HQL27005.1 transketolase [Anaerolineaceae bacterium]